MLERLTESVAILDTEALGEKGVVAAYLISGKEKALIDMGYRSSAQVVIGDLNASGVSDDDLDYLLPTHVHLDHCGACGALAQRFPNASILVHPRGVTHLSDPTRLVKGAGELFGQKLMERFGLPDPIEKRRVRGVADDEAIDLGRGVVLRSIWTPGHAPHHLSYLLEGSGVLLTGDAVGVRHPAFPVLVPTTPPPSFDLNKAIESLQRISQLSVSKLCTPHFGVLEGGRELIDQNASALMDWKSKLEVLMSEGGTIDEMVNRLTDDVRRRFASSKVDAPEYLRVMIRISVLGFVGYLRRVST